MVRAGAELGVCDQLAAGPLPADEIARRVGAEPDVLHRLLRALAAFGILEEREDGTYANTELGELLNGDNPDSMRSFALGLADDSWWGAWAQLPEAVRDGSVPIQRAYGRSFWSLVDSDPDVKARFNAFMASQTQAFGRQLVAAFDFAACKRVVDVGGGNGGLLAAVLAANDSLRGTLFDLPYGLDGAEAYLKSRGVHERCDLVAGDFFESVPAGGDAYLLSRILHDWPDERAAEILASIRRAMAPGSYLLAIDSLMPEHVEERADHQFLVTMDLHMYTLFGARERTEDQMRRLLSGAGFEVARVAPTWPVATIIAKAV